MALGAAARAAGDLSCRAARCGDSAAPASSTASASMRASASGSTRPTCLSRWCAGRAGALRGQPPCARFRATGSMRIAGPVRARRQRTGPSTATRSSSRATSRSGATSGDRRARNAMDDAGVDDCGMLPRLDVWAAVRTRGADRCRFCGKLRLLSGAPVDQICPAGTPAAFRLRSMRAPMPSIAASTTRPTRAISPASISAARNSRGRGLCPCRTRQTFVAINTFPRAAVLAARDRRCGERRGRCSSR